MDDKQFRRLACVASMALGFLLTSDSLSQEEADLTGDGIDERIERDACGPGWDVIDGATNQVLANITGFGGDKFGTFAGFTPDLSSDGVHDIIVITPAAIVNGVPVGRTYLFSGSTFNALWVVDGTANHRFFPGFATIPDHNSDGVEEIAIRSVSSHDFTIEYTTILNGQYGTVLRTIRGPMPEYAFLARGGTRLFASTDINRTGLVDATDVAELSQAAALDDHAGDVNADGSINWADFQAVLVEQGTLVPIGYDLPGIAAIPATGQRIPVVQHGAELLLFGDSDEYIVVDPFLQLRDGPNIQCDVITAMSAFLEEHATELVVLATCVDKRPRLGYSPTSNGFGSGPISSWCADLSPYEVLFDTCCNDHDTCYGSCNANKSSCVLYS